jgi:hypothetical protein
LIAVETRITAGVYNPGEEDDPFSVGSSLN